MSEVFMIQCDGATSYRYLFQETAQQAVETFLRHEQVLAPVRVVWGSVINGYPEELRRQARDSFIARGRHVTAVGLENGARAVFVLTGKVPEGFDWDERGRMIPREETIVACMPRYGYDPDLWDFPTVSVGDKVFNLCCDSGVVPVDRLPTIKNIPEGGFFFAYSSQDQSGAAELKAKLVDIHNARRTVSNVRKLACDTHKQRRAAASFLIDKLGYSPEAAALLLERPPNT